MKNGWQIHILPGRRSLFRILQSCNTHCSQHQAAHSSNVRAGKHTSVLSVAAPGLRDTAAAPGDKDVENYAV